MCNRFKQRQTLEKSFSIATFFKTKNVCLYFIFKANVFVISKKSLKILIFLHFTVDVMENPTNFPYQYFFSSFKWQDIHSIDGWLGQLCVFSSSRNVTRIVFARFNIANRKSHWIETGGNATLTYFSRIHGFFLFSKLLLLLLLFNQRRRKNATAPYNVSNSTEYVEREAGALQHRKIQWLYKTHIHTIFNADKFFGWWFEWRHEQTTASSISSACWCWVYVKYTKIPLRLRWENNKNLKKRTEKSREWEFQNETETQNINRKTSKYNTKQLQRIPKNKRTKWKDEENLFNVSEHFS